MIKSLPNLLIVDDNDSNLALLEVILGKLPVNLITAESGIDALEKTKGMELALAILDIKMPEMNGFELAVKINEDRGGNIVPIIFVTANCVNEIVVTQGYNSGAVDCIFKPVNKLILLSKINVFLDLYNQKQTIIWETVLLKKTTDELTRVNNALEKSKEKLIESEERNKRIISGITDYVYTVNIKDGKAIEAIHNEVCLIVTGYSCEEFKADTYLWINMVVPEERKWVVERFSKILEGKDLPPFEYRIICKDGEIRWISNSTILHFDSNGTLVSYDGIIKDITEDKLAEQALRVSEEKYKTLLNASPDGILLIDLRGTITEVSEIGFELFDADHRDDLIGKNFLQFIPSEETNSIKDIFEKTLSEGLVQDVELKIRKKNQSTFQSEISSTLIQSPDGEPLSFMIIIRDITQRKKIETAQIHADRLANLGQMAAGIAHEINQPLNIISMVLDKILFEAAKTETIDLEFFKNKSDKIFENIIRIRNIIDHVRTFSRNQDDIKTAFDINASIENAVSMYMEQFKHMGIMLDLQLEKGIPLLAGNTYRFEQVIINLLTNAKDAVLERENRQGGYGNMTIGIKSFQENQFLIVEISDNGIGIGNDDIHNIILPFYTTKEEGKGTGLGLSICYQIIKEMNGAIEVSSDKVNGTVIKLVLDFQKKK